MAPAGLMVAWAADIESRKGLPVLERRRGHITFDLGGGLKQSVCTGRSIHYEATPGVWAPISTELIDDGAWLAGVGTPVRIAKATGAAHRRDGGNSARPSRVVRFRPSKESTSTIATVPASGGTISDEWYEREWGDAPNRLRYRQRCHEDGVYSELWIESQPSFPGGTKDDDYICLEEEAVGYDDLALGWHDEGFWRDGYWYKLPDAWDSSDPDNPQRIPVRRYLLETGGQRYWLTGIMKADLDGAVYPVTLDETDYEASTDDAYIRGLSATYADARSTAGYHNSSATGLYSGQWVSGGNYFVFRSALKFLTADIPDGDTISDVTMDLAVFTDYSDTDFDVEIVKYDWSGSDPVSTGNRDTIYDGILAAAKDVTWRNTSGISTWTVYTSPSMDTSWVSKTGPTYYGIISSRDISATTPTGYEALKHPSQNHGSPSYRPVLTVTHAAGGGGLSIPIAMANYRRRRSA